MGEEVVTGIYSSEARQWIGTGTTRRKTITRKFWFACQADDGMVQCVPLTGNLVPSGTPRLVSDEEFAETFKYEPDFYIDLGQFKKLMPERTGVPEKTPDNGIAPDGKASRAVRQVAATDESAWPELSHHELELKETKARADFSMGLAHYQRGDRESAKKMLAAIPDMPVRWQPRHKHMFCEFGVGLRKTNLHDVALKHYFKALELAPADENLCHNIARVFFEQNRYDDCQQWLKKSLEINPALKPSIQFLRYLEKSGKLSQVEGGRTSRRP